ncbi:olfactory receptor class A-like protein 1 [Spea bombifrons]|uniref:olfactory receptor class A-like protein 1 n=1 Tax=Spea bombifrons TaxID=233779 RepID=UPI00234BC050|nr:olfactory receptor class A-like protein 1 [Spea bombifrons]
MDLCFIIKGVSFFVQTSIGIVSNWAILISYLNMVCHRYKLMPVDIVLSHLAFVNMMTLLTRGVPQTMTVFGMVHVLNDAGCKAVIYSYRIVRALSVSVTCLLSVLQAVTIKPTPGRSIAKIKDLKYLIMTLVVIWLINMAVCIAAPFFSAVPRIGKVPKFTLDLGFCHVYFPNQLGYIINGFAVSARDFTFVGIMIFASGFIMQTLYRHRTQVQNLRLSNSRNGAAESKAAKNVLRLVLLYVIFFGVDNIIWIYMLTVSQVPSIVSDMRVFFSSCYASLSPILIILSNKKIRSSMKCTLRQQITQVEIYVCHV